MASYLELFSLVTDETFQRRIRFAVLRASYDIKNEAMSVADHQRRLAWAERMLANEHVDLGAIALGVVLNPSIGALGALAPDSDIQFVVNSLVPEMVKK